MHVSRPRHFPAHLRAPPDSALSFGVSGILRNSALVMYDRLTYSLWTQEGVAIAGLFKGARLRIMPSELTTWEAWHRRHPHTLVMLPPAEGARRAE